MGINEDQLHQIFTLISKSINTELSREEQHVLDNWLNMDKGNRTLFNELHNPAYRLEQLKEMAQFTADDAALDNFLKKHHKPSLKAKRNLFISRLAAAAIIIMVVGATLYMYNTKKMVSKNSKIAAQTDINPGKNIALLTLGNGKTIKLSELKNGVVINSSGLKYDDGSPVMQTNINPNNVTMLTASTPNGGMYALTLPDGTKVWLNSKSSLQFPSSFAGKPKRKVILSGEAYFEVAKDKTHPFIVVTPMQEVKVMGTHFNINAYAEDATTTTTLLEGSIYVLNLKLNHWQKLVPNQQAVLSDAVLQVKDVSDAGNAIDWKNGDFILKEERLESIMRKLARWYDVEIVYSNKPQKPVVLGGLISRQKTLSAALRFIETTEKVHFEIEGKKVIVTYK